MSSSSPPASLLTLPPELRNTIYLYIFTPPCSFSDAPSFRDPDDPLAVALKLQAYSPQPASAEPHHTHDLRLLQTCRQIYSEAHLLALALTTFHMTGTRSEPERFHAGARDLSFDQLGALRHLTLTAKIPQLRPLNESWRGLPFGHAGLDLDTLTIIPRKPDASHSAYAEVADLSQSHTLAYICAEAFKTLRNVRVVQMRNHGCFNDVVWRVVYRSLVYRMWRWGGLRCGVRFECGGEEEGEEAGSQWLRVFLQDSEEGAEAGEEVVRLVGASGALPDPNLAGF